MIIMNEKYKTPELETVIKFGEQIYRFIENFAQIYNYLNSYLKLINIQK